MPETGEINQFEVGVYVLLKAKDSESSWDFCYAVGNSIKTLLAGKSHFFLFSLEDGDGPSQ